MRVFNHTLLKMNQIQSLFSLTLLLFFTSASLGKPGRPWSTWFQPRVQQQPVEMANQFSSTGKTALPSSRQLTNGIYAGSSSSSSNQFFGAGNTGLPSSNVNTGGPVAQHERVLSLMDQPFSPEPGNLLAGRYKLMEGIGRGLYGTIYRVHDLVENRHKAIKVEKRMFPTAVNKEWKVSEKIRNSGYPSARHCLQYEQLIRLKDLDVLVMPLMHGNLFSQFGRSRPLDQQLTQTILNQIEQCVALMHKLEIQHGDLSTLNVLVRNQNPVDVVVADYGGSQDLWSPVVNQDNEDYDQIKGIDLWLAGK